MDCILLQLLWHSGKCFLRRTSMASEKHIYTICSSQRPVSLILKERKETAGAQKQVSTWPNPYRFQVTWKVLNLYLNAFYSSSINNVSAQELVRDTKVPAGAQIWLRWTAKRHLHNRLSLFSQYREANTRQEQCWCNKL